MVVVRRGDYEGREQAYVKHFVLERYLQQLALKVGHFRPGTTLNYIDGFSGPWQQATQDLRDTSPHVALTELLEARAELGRSEKEFNVRGFFVERDPEAFERLQGLLRAFSSAETVAYRGEFEAHVEEARRFATQGRNPFAFILIDPTGWTGYPLAAITPLLRVEPCEVLINFMTKDIMRFVDDESSSARESFNELFGDDVHRDEWRALAGSEREDRIVEAYGDRLRIAGKFRHVGATVVLHPQHDRTHYHLVYATRSLHGLVAFREAERRAMPEQKGIRAAARQKGREGRTGQQELFGAAAMETSYMDELRERYHGRARSKIEALLAQRGSAPFDEVIGAALEVPMTSLGDLKGWLEELRSEGRVEYVGLAAGQRTLKEGQRHAVSWRG